jgi:hypothetical protein
MPITRAIAAVVGRTGCTRKAARAALEEVGPCEWHHTGKFANQTDYYDVDGACRLIIAQRDPLYEDRSAAVVVETNANGWLRYHDRRRAIEPADYMCPELRDLNLSPSAKRADAEHREDVAADIQWAASFRRWEAALRRLAASEAM